MGHFRRKFIRFYRKNKFPLLFDFAVAVLSLMLFKFLKTREISQPPKFYGNINEIIIPSSFITNYTPVFKYNDEIFKNKNCFDRDKYQYEFLRLIHAHPYDLKTYELKYSIVIGSKTTIGASIVKKLREKHLPVIEIAGIYDIGFPDEQTNGVLFNLSIRQLFICSQPVFPLTNKEDPLTLYKKNSQMYYDCILKWSANMKIPTVCVFTPPYPKEEFKKINWFCSSVVLVPYIPEISQYDDLSNPYVKVYQDCVYSGHSEVMSSDYPVIAADSETIAEKIIEIVRENAMEVTLISSSISERIKSTMNVFADSFPYRCRVKLTKSLIGKVPELSEAKVITIDNSDTNVPQMLKESIFRVPRGSTKRSFDNPYISLVITGTCDLNEGNFSSIVQNYLKDVGKSVDKVPEALIEIIIVDFPFLSNETKLSDYVNTPDELTGLVRYVEVTNVNNQTYKHFPEFLGKNIGIRHARGEFVLITNPDVFLPTELFQIVASRQLNEGVIYRAETLECNNIEDNPINCVNRCPKFTGFYLVRNKFEDELSIGCNSMNFILTSKDLWYSINGLTEYPLNDDFDSLQFAKFMKIVPGMPIMFLPFQTLHYNKYHKEETKSNDIEKDVAVKQYYCYGDTDYNSKYHESLKWGFHDYKFNITVK